MLLLISSRDVSMESCLVGAATGTCHQAEVLAACTWLYRHIRLSASACWRPPPTATESDWLNATSACRTLLDRKLSLATADSGMAASNAPTTRMKTKRRRPLTARTPLFS